MRISSEEAAQRRWCGVHRSCRADRCTSHYARKRDGHRSSSDIGRPRAKRAVKRSVAQEYVLRERIKENAPAAANHRFTLAGQVVGECHAWRDVLVVRIVELRRATRRAYLRQSAARRWADLIEQIILLARYAEVVPTKAEVQRQTCGRAEAVLQIDSVAVFKFMPQCVAFRLTAAGWNSFQKRSQVAETQLASEI